MDGLAFAHHALSAAVCTVDFLAKLDSQYCSDVGYIVISRTSSSCLRSRPPRWGGGGGDRLWATAGGGCTHQRIEGCESCGGDGVFDEPTGRRCEHGSSFIRDNQGAAGGMLLNPVQLLGIHITHNVLHHALKRAFGPFQVDCRTIRATGMKSERGCRDTCR